ncbi:hypothetical protein NQ315_014618 [Exocentrus adspersus]|uniref:Uncharacterized protein n=1 Tax=Exocentrus adspersus TaxID=1586481 RepID=A0AAV8VQY2_9CUCU|nr:hypothetical protein NQ315_014618 [Exocentrus adspersus]
MRCQVTKYGVELQHEVSNYIMRCRITTRVYPSTRQQLVEIKPNQHHPNQTMSFYLSEEIRQELKEACQDHISINKVIEEALSEEVTIDTALQAVESLEQAALPGPSPSKGFPSTSKGLKRSAVDQDNAANSDDDFVIPPSGRSSSAALPKTRGKNLSLIRKPMRSRAASPTDSVCSSFSSSSSSNPKASNEHWMAKIDQELQRREEFNRAMDSKAADITEKIKGSGDRISRIRGAETVFEGS